MVSHMKLSSKHDIQEKALNQNAHGGMSETFSDLQRKMSLL